MPAQCTIHCLNTKLLSRGPFVFKRSRSKLYQGVSSVEYLVVLVLSFMCCQLKGRPLFIQRQDKGPFWKHSYILNEISLTSNQVVELCGNEDWTSVSHQKASRCGIKFESRGKIITTQDRGFFCSHHFEKYQWILSKNYVKKWPQNGPLSCYVYSSVGEGFGSIDLNFRNLKSCWSIMWKTGLDTMLDIKRSAGVALKVNLEEKSSHCVAPSINYKYIHHDFERLDI